VGRGRASCAWRGQFARRGGAACVGRRFGRSRRVVSPSVAWPSIVFGLAVDLTCENYGSLFL